MFYGRDLLHNFYDVYDFNNIIHTIKLSCRYAFTDVERLTQPYLNLLGF